MDNKNPKSQKFTFLHTGKFPIHYVILNSALSNRIILFKLRNTVKQTFSPRAKRIPSTDIVASILLRYSVVLNYECKIRERTATIAIDLKIESNVTQELK